MNNLLEELRHRNEKVLSKLLSAHDAPPQLIEAMRYSALSGGKRLRALLVYSAGLATNAPLSRLDHVAAAIECIHAYSLIHDDLPAMDDDDLRRGLATNHIKFDEATAILAGDALQTFAFQTISSDASDLTDLQARRITHQLSIGSGFTGMVGGQMLDILATGKSLEQDALEQIHRRKTGALITASVLCGALCSDYCSRKNFADLESFAQNIGLAFQVKDDILDIESSTEVLGKTSGADQELGKSTYPAILGLDESKKLATDLYQSAMASLASIGDNTEHLADIAERIVNRDH